MNYERIISHGLLPHKRDQGFVERVAHFVVSAVRSQWSPVVRAHVQNHTGKAKQLCRSN